MADENVIPKNIIELTREMYPNDPIIRGELLGICREGIRIGKRRGIRIGQEQEKERFLAKMEKIGIRHLGSENEGHLLIPNYEKGKEDGRAEALEEEHQFGFDKDNNLICMNHPEEKYLTAIEINRMLEQARQDFAEELIEDLSSRNGYEPWIEEVIREALKKKDVI